MKMDTSIASLLILLLCITTSYTAPTFSVDYANNQFLKDGKPFRYISGDFEYFKVPSVLWRETMQKIKQSGVNAIQTYISWNLHEPERGVFDWSGDNDIEQFFRLARELDLVVVLRPGPFINAEMDMGGLPYWLLSLKNDMKVRSMDPTYIQEVDRYMSVLLPKIKPHLYQNNGSIILVQIENEYGFWPEFTVPKISCDYAYLTHLRDLFKSYLGNDAVLFTTDGWEFINCGKVDQVLSTIDFGAHVNPRAAFTRLREHQEFGPYVNSEYYTGWINRWEMPYEKVEAKNIADTLDAILAMNASVNLYPMAGGTLFGFNAGATHAKDGGVDFHPTVTSYEFDGPMTEAGDPNEKYAILRNVIGKYNSLPAGGIPAVAPKMQLTPIKLRPISTIFDVMQVTGSPVSSQFPRTFEQLNLRQGFVLYSTNITFFPTDPVVLSVPNLRDRAQVFLDKEYLGTLSRTQEIYDLPLRAKKGQHLEIFVENQGRFAFLDVGELKGIVKNVTLGVALMGNWTQHLYFKNWTTAIPQVESRALTSLQYRKGVPTFFSGNFTLPNAKVNDTFLRMDGFSKGLAFLNNFNLGRYWPSVGPQITLYVPKHLFKPYPAENRITLLELEESPCEDLGRCSVQFVRDHVLNATTPLIIAENLWHQ